MNQRFVDILSLVAPSVISPDFGIECDIGWFPIIYEAVIEIEAENRRTTTDMHIKASQIKEKFGTLRFYTDLTSDAAEAAISAAEKASVKICEECGQDGTLREGGWLKTRCDDCDRNHRIVMTQLRKSFVLPKKG